MNPSDLPQVLPKLLRKIPTLAISTIDDAAQPHAANVNFVSDEQLTCYWLSSPDTAHSRHIAARSRIAACGYVPFRIPRNIRGVQFHGTAELCDSVDWLDHWRRFCRKFPYAIPFQRTARAESFYRLRPSWVRLIDNSVKFGFKLASDWPPT